MALGLGQGDLWWTSPNTFCATADAALRCGAEVDFIDIEWGTYNMDLGLLEDLTDSGGVTDSRWWRMRPTPPETSSGEKE